MDLSNLSSNWKKLQQSLKNGQSGTQQAKPLLKRKALSELHSQGKKKHKKKDDGQLNGSSESTSNPSQQPPKKHSQQPMASAAPPPPPPNGMSPPPTTAAGGAGAEDSTNPLDSKPAQAGKYVALDCEMVGTRDVTPLSVPANSAVAPGEFSILARVSVVSYDLGLLYDAYVLPPPGVGVTDYRTPWSGITAWHLNPANPTTRPVAFETAQRHVAALIDGRILVGHALKNDLAVLGLGHPKHNIRDTSRHPPFRALAAAAPGRKGRTPALKRLVKELLGRDIQADDVKGHSSVEDARAAMEVFRTDKKGFDEEVLKTFGRRSVVTVAKVNINAEDSDEEAEASEGEESPDEDDGEQDEHGASGTKKKKRKKGKKKRKGRYR